MLDPNHAADKLEEISRMMLQLAKILRGEEQDLTGRGYWKILCERLGQAMDCKVITMKQYEAFVKLSDEDFKRRDSGSKSY